jgi:hypothetical protein
LGFFVESGAGVAALAFNVSRAAPVAFRGAARCVVFGFGFGFAFVES